MKTFTVTFTNGLTVTTQAADREHAQELAIEQLEDQGVVHTTIRSVRVVA